jgi:choloylglycine hydrolase
MKKQLFCLVSIALSFFFVPGSRACTTFTLQKGGNVVYGRNLDWHADSGLLFINPRQVEKKAMVLNLKPRASNPAVWTSRYGSVTFNSVGREFPTGGMNEAGLVVDVMWLHTTRYPKADSRPELSALQWVQYLLDTCQNVEEVLAAESKVRISEDGFPPQHFLIGDRTGATAVIEFIGGAMCVYKGASLPYSALANDTYADSEKYARQFQGFGGQKALLEGDGSLDRFVRAAAAVRSFASPSRKMVDYSFQILHSVNAGYELNRHATVWSIVYDIRNKKIHFRTNSNRDIRRVNLAKIDFSNRKPARVWNVLNDLTGDITRKTIPYTKELNRETIVRQVTNPGVVGLFGDLRALIEPVAAYPETCTACKP